MCPSSTSHPGTMSSVTSTRPVPIQTPPHISPTPSVMPPIQHSVPGTPFATNIVPTTDLAAVDPDATVIFRDNPFNTGLAAGLIVTIVLLVTMTVIVVIAFFVKRRNTRTRSSGHMNSSSGRLDESFSQDTDESIESKRVFL